jgi:hypothetical protein
MTIKRETVRATPAVAIAPRQRKKNLSPTKGGEVIDYRKIKLRC